MDQDDIKLYHEILKINIQEEKTIIRQIKIKMDILNKCYYHDREFADERKN